jgi:hypothetical protein
MVLVSNEKSAGMIGLIETQPVKECQKEVG